MNQRHPASPRPPAQRVSQNHRKRPAQRPHSQAQLVATPPPLAADSLAQALLHVASIVARVMEGETLDYALAQQLATSQQRGAVQDLSYETLRQYGRGDFLLTQLLQKPLLQEGQSSPERLQIHALLLVALMRLEQRAQDTHTTVDQAVTAAAQFAHGRYKSLVNAVLRNYLRQANTLKQTLEQDIVARHQHPRWWLEKLRRSYPEHWQDIAHTGNTRPPMTLRIRHQRNSMDTALAYQQTLAAQDIAARPLDATALLLERPVAVERLPDFLTGRVSVQDWGAQQAARLLDVADGQRVLDACAAPGGKTTHLLEQAQLELLALDSQASRCQRIHENLQRLNLTARVKTADVRQLNNWWDGRPFDRILADVPCSASGVVRRHPDIKWLRRESDIPGFVRLQREILDALWTVLAPGGKLLYCTCSLFVEENRGQIEAFLERQPQARLLSLSAPTTGLPAVLEQSLNARDNRGGSALQLLAHAEHDGFFYALLQKSS